MEEMLKVREELKRLKRPSDRDLEIFERVAGRKEPQERVARACGVTQGRVSQIVAAVRDWLVAATDDEAGDLPPELALRYARRVARMRLEGLLGICMEGFRESQLDKTRPGNCGDPRWLTHYRNTALAVARFDGVPTAPKVDRDAEVDPQVVARVVASLQAQAAAMEAAIEVEEMQSAPAAKPAASSLPIEEELALYSALLDKLDQMPELAAGMAASDEIPAAYAAEANVGSALQATAKSEKKANKLQPSSLYPQASAAERRRAFLRGTAA